MVAQKMFHLGSQADYCGSQLRKMWEKAEKIVFLANTITVVMQQGNQSLTPKNMDDEQEHSDHEDETWIEGVVGLSEEVRGTMKKAKSTLLVRKGDSIPLLVLAVLDCRFRIFLCGCKCTWDGSSNGTWLESTGKTLPNAVALPYWDTMRENCVLWNARKNCMEVLTCVWWPIVIT